jgi:hypothetical protein
MPSPNDGFRLHGAAEPPPEAHPLRAGPLSVLLEGADLRYVRLGSREIVRRLYVAVRDHNWDTIPLQLSKLSVQAKPESFEVTFEASHVQGAVDFAWRGAILGRSDGSLSYTLDGAPRAVFRRNRIGICVLYPIHECAGQPCRIVHVDGTVEASLFPAEIGPQLVIDGIIWPVLPFANMRGIEHEVAPGIVAATTFEGDTFEMEDQRNWTDASYKIYSTPLALPWPVEVGPDKQVRQRFGLHLHGDGAALAAAPAGDAGTVRVRVGEACGRLPALGFGVASHGEPLGEQERVRLQALRPAHLRVDLDLSEPGYQRRLAVAQVQARQVQARLELALLLSDEGERELRALAAVLEADPADIARFLVFHKGEKSTSARWLEQARQVLQGAPIYGGTNIYFTELNRARPPLELVDGVAYSINPQVHAFDNRSLVETLAAQGATVRSARVFCGQKPLAISPVTLRPRFNPNATGPEPAPGPGELPSQVDGRQMALLGAGWTLGSLKYLAEAGAESVTYYETTGWRGLMERPAGSPVPDTFPSQPGQLFPLYHVFAAVAPLLEGEVVASQSSAPLVVESLALRAGGRARLLVANVSDEPCAVALEGLPPGQASLRRLDAEAYELAAEQEALLEAGGHAVMIGDAGLHLHLAPYGLICIDTDSNTEER